MTEAIQLLPIFRERVWGRENLAPFFSNTPPNRRIGEVWLTFEENATSLGEPLGELIKRNPTMLGSAADPEHPGICPLLVKLLFTTERLSVQVHPDDEYARQHHQSLGKTEAWYVLDSRPPGEVAVGFRQALTAQGFKAAAQSGEIEQLLDWRKVKTGDVVFVPAGTVHAIGAGLTICEIQENSDITYRLYDYGRPRELHLEHGIEVSRLEPNGFNAKGRALAEWREELVECPYFRIERLRLQRPIRIDRGLPYYLVLICVNGSGTIADRAFATGQAWMIPAQNAEIQIAGDESEWILTYTANKPVSHLHEAS